MKNLKKLFVSLFYTAAIIFAATPELFARGTGEQKFVRMALSGNPDTLDPHKTAGTLTFQVAKSLYDTLLEPDVQGNLVPALAERWEFQDGDKTLIFYLRDGVKFHDGTGFTSRDVEKTLERVMAKSTGSPHATEFSPIQKIETPDPGTVILRLSAPSAPLLSTLASGWGAILPAHLIEAGHDFGSHPVGTGPFALKEWIRDNKLVLVKNPSYWQPQKPKIGGIEFRIITERSIQVQGLLSGQLDIVDMYDNIDVPLIEKNPSIRIEKNLTSLVMVLAMNTKRPPLTDIRVRQAINYAIDKQKVLDIAYGGGVPVGTFMDPSDPVYKDFTHLYPYNPEKARQLLSEAGVGPETVLEMPLPQNFEPHVRAGQMYQEMLQQVGLSSKIKLVDWSTWISDVYRNANFDLTVIGHTGKLDPDSRLAGYGTEQTYVRWVNPEAASLINQARTLPDPHKRKTLYQRVLEIMAREVPFVYTGTSYRYLGIRNTIQGFLMQPKLDTYDFRNVEVQ